MYYAHFSVFLFSFSFPQTLTNSIKNIKTIDNYVNCYSFHFAVADCHLLQQFFNSLRHDIFEGKPIGRTAIGAGSQGFDLSMQDSKYFSTRPEQPAVLKKLKASKTNGVSLVQCCYVGTRHLSTYNCKRLSQQIAAHQRHS